MSEHIHRYLDGELDFHALDAEDRQELAIYRLALGETREALLREPAPDLTAEVMRRVAALEGREVVETPRERTPSDGRSGPLVGLLRLLWQPRTVTLRPAVAVVALGAAVLVFAGQDTFVGGRDGVPIQPGGTAVVRDGAQVQIVRVRFRLDAPSASSVSLAGDFTRWQPTVALRQEAPGVWSAVVPLVPGVHDYAFVIDGSEWVIDPLAQRVEDGFGGQNSRVAVLVQGGQS